MKTHLSKIPIILASTSPRRIDMMKQVQLSVEVQAPLTTEIIRKGEKPRALVSRLSRQKADSVRQLASQRHPSSIILAADTIVVAPLGKEILGKPKNRADALRMLQLLAGRTHSVLTGYCAILVKRQKPDRRIVRVIQSQVKMRPMSRNTIARYIESGESMDKAGGYAAQGLGMALIERIEGSYTNVVGLPIAQVFLDFENTFGIKLLSWTK
jgi:septum formation protein